MEPTDGAVNHRVLVHDVATWLTSHVGIDVASREPSTLEWLAIPQQNLAEVTGGAVFHDGLGTLEPARRRLAWYPDQVWRYLLACQWQRLSDEEAFVGRCAEVGDELGSAVVASRLVRDMMRLCLLLERRHAPYSKWLASAFAELPVATALIPSLEGAVSARDHPTRERHLCTAYETVAQIQNRSGLAEALDPACRTYHGRPYMVLHAERFAIALHETVTDPILRRLPRTGGVDQWADSTSLLQRPTAIRGAIEALL